SGGPGQIAIDIETIPNGAAVLLDATPLAEPKVILSLTDKQPHTIVAHAGCRRAEAEMTAADLASFKGPLVLELAPRREDVLIGSEPSGARIEVNGKETDKTTPAAISLEGCEARSITLVHEGYRPWTREYDADADFDAMVEALKKVSLEAIPSGMLLIKKPKEYDLDIYAGESKIGRAGDTIALPEGKHALSFRNEAYFVRESASVVITGGKTTSPLINFPALGTLTVQAQPSNCKVYIDERYVDVTPVLERPIAAGGHRVKVVFVPNGSTQEVTVSVDAGKNALAMVKF
ncbi:MAG TPA: PEGA domain-containing protein, partial [Candidatus Polarisedimenticolia bacterium]